MTPPATLADTLRQSGLFDEAFYRGQAADRSMEVGADAVAHYVGAGDAAGLWPNPLFDTTYYKAEAATTDNGLAHYLAAGTAAGLRTHPLFDTAYYVKLNPDVTAAGVNPLRHFLASGGFEGRRPHPLFLTWNYAHAVPGLVESRENPLIHYIREGWRADVDPHPLFDSKFYRSRYPEAAGQNPLLHFLCGGLAAGRRPNLRFSREYFSRTGADPDRLADDTLLAACLEERSSEEDYAVLHEEIALRRPPPQAAVAGPAGADPAPMLIAFYLPQFHPIPENDKNWGEGFTEWVNVRQAKPNFTGHNQPRIPGELGYYDLRDPQTLQRQAELAQSYGVHGFCYYWYWFNGHKPLALPLEQMLASAQPNMPFCLCWANEGWTRKWAGGDEVILGHDYGEADDRAHAADLARYMRDPRYIRVAGVPLLLIYRGGVLPDAVSYLRQWRGMFADLGIPSIHFAMVESAELAWAGKDPRSLGFDSAVEFPPHAGTGLLPPLPTMLNPDFSGAIFDYRETVIRYAMAPRPDYPRARTVMGAWDNTARYQNGPATFINATPGGYRAWLESSILDARESHPPGQRMVFINAWNEWGEGTYLEPDERWGRAYLEATRDALATTAAQTG